MQLYDWLMVTSIACVIVATISAVYLLSRLRQAIDLKTQLVKEGTQAMIAVPNEVSREVRSTIFDIKEKVQLGWKIFSFIRRRRLKKKLKKLKKQEMRR